MAAGSPSRNAWVTIGVRVGDGEGAGVSEGGGGSEGRDMKVGVGSGAGDSPQPASKNTKTSIIFFSMALPQARLSRADDSLRPIRHLQFAENAGDVIAHRLRANHQLLGNVLV